MRFKPFRYFVSGLLLLFAAARAPRFLFADLSASERRNLYLSQTQTALGLSRNVGQISDAEGDFSRSLPRFILIQDVHNHPEAQEHIASVIMHGYKFWGVKKVFLEGAFSSVDLSVFHRVPDLMRLALMKRLVQSGDLSGPELAAVILSEAEWRNPPVNPFQLIGLESPRLYEQNLEVYQQVQIHRDEALRALEEIRRLQIGLQLLPSNPLPQQLVRTEDLIRLKMTPDEYAAYRSARFAIPSAPELDLARRLAERFYSLVQERSHAFIVQAEAKVPAGAGPRILVVGGFHTARMARELKAQGYSYVVITPRITRTGYESLYERRMLESISALQVTQPFSLPAAPHRQNGR